MVNLFGLEEEDSDEGQPAGGPIFLQHDPDDVEEWWSVDTLLDREDKWRRRVLVGL